MRRLSLSVALGCLILATPRLACAQEAGGADSARIHLGPVGLKPRISLGNIGIDTNVHNDPTNPEHDFTMTLVPGVDSFLPIGRGVLTGKTSYELLYFKKQADQRAANISQSARFDLTLTRFAPYVLTDYASTNRRPNAEIDARVHQVTKTYGAGAATKVGGRTTMSVEFSRATFGLGNDVFQGVNLAAALDHRSDMMSATFSRALTPLTTFSLTGVVQHDRFEGSSTRDSDIVRFMPSVSFKPSAIISGQASVGYTRFRPLNTDVPGFAGLTAAVNLTYILKDWTKFGVTVNRETSYSFENNTPYYVVTGAVLSVAQALGQRFDLTGQLGRQYLDYRQIATAAAAGADASRLDRTVAYSLGLGYHLSDDMRIGFNVDYNRRMSPVESRHYDGYRFGGTVSYAY